MSGGNCNPESVRGVVLEAAPSAEAEIAAFDSLGPLTRRAIEQSSIKVLAHALLAQCTANGWRPDSAKVDAHVARCVTEQMRNLVPVVPIEFSYSPAEAAAERSAALRRKVARAERRLG